MSALWHFFARRVTIETGVNDVIAYTDSGGNDTITLDAGDYYVLGDESAADILGHIVTKLNADSPDTYTLTVLTNLAGRFASTDRVHNIAIDSNNAAFKLRWASGSGTTFDSTLVGWPASDTSAGAGQTAPQDPFAVWVASQPPALAEPRLTRLGNATRTVGGTHYGFQRGGPFAERDYQFRLVDGDMVFDELTDETGGTFEQFLTTCGASTPFRVYTCTPGSGDSIWQSSDNPSPDVLTLLSTHAFGAGFFNEFAPTRDTQGLEVYSFSFRAMGAT